jgi:kynureninase
MEAVLGWLEEEGAGPKEIHAHVTALQDHFLGIVARLPGRMMPGRSLPRGNFLTFQTDDAAATYRALHDRRVITDYRRDRLRIGFGVYQTREMVTGLVEALEAVT